MSHPTFSFDAPKKHLHTTGKTMEYDDLRGFLDLLEDRRELIRIKEPVDWDIEIGAISQESICRNGAAFICENIKDYTETPCRRLSMNYLGNWKRMALAMGMPEDTHPKEMVLEWRRGNRQLIKPLLVDTGPCKDNIVYENEVDISQFPIPKLHTGDGGRYALTWHIVVTEDPDTGWMNVGTYRGMMLDKKNIGVLLSPNQHWGLHATKYRGLNKPMPVAAVLGTDPVTIMASATPYPEGLNEYDVIGAIRGEPVQLVKCETSELMVPANAEIVLEGEINLDPSSYRKEGPFGEYPGFYSSIDSTPKPVFNVKCITYRDDPIFTAGLIGVGPHLRAADPDLMGAVTLSAVTWDQLELNKVPGVTDVWFDEDMWGTNVFVSIDKKYYGHARQVAFAVWAASSAKYIGKYVVVVDADIDIHNPKKIWAAIANRTNPSKDIMIVPHTAGGRLDPSIHPDIKMETGIGRWDRVLIDATWDDTWEERSEWGGLNHPPSCLSEESELKPVREKWAQYGFEQRNSTLWTQ
ncbi:MAG: UbiD family decarboxylase [Desulfobacterales bacterium]|nr:UbiD family decarboxylase [Desulfobacterales bacterium]